MSTNKEAFLGEAFTYSHERNMRSVWKTTSEAIEASPYRLLVTSKWGVLFRPISAKTGKPYFGVNLALLSWYLSSHPEKIPIFMTFDAAKKLVFTKPAEVPSSLKEFRQCISFSETKIPGQHIAKGTKSASVVVPASFERRAETAEPFQPQDALEFKTLPLFSICDVAGADSIGAMMDTLNAMHRQHMESVNVNQLTTQDYLLMILRSARFKPSNGDWMDIPRHSDRTSIVDNTISSSLTHVHPSGALTVAEIGALVTYLFDFVSEQLEVCSERTEQEPKKKRKFGINVKPIATVLACEYILGALAAACSEELTDAHCLYDPFVSVATSLCPTYRWGHYTRFGVSENELKKAFTDAVTIGNTVLDGSIGGIVAQRCTTVACLQKAFPWLFGPLGEFAFNIDVLQRILRHAYPIPRPLRVAPSEPSQD